MLVGSLETRACMELQNGSFLSFHRRKDCIIISFPHEEKLRQISLNNEEFSNLQALLSSLYQIKMADKVNEKEQNEDPPQA